MKLRIAPQPAKVEAVEPNDARIGRGPLTKIEETVRADHRAVGMMVAQAGQALNERRGLASGGDPQNFSRLERAPGDVERAVREGHTIPRWIGAAGNDLGATADLHPQEARGRYNFAVSVTRLGDVHTPPVVERHPGREGETCGDSFDLVAVQQRDIGGIDAARRRELRLPPALRLEDRKAGGETQRHETRAEQDAETPPQKRCCRDRPGTLFLAGHEVLL